MANTYYEIVVKGDGKLLKGFIRGFEIGRALQGRIWLCGDHPFDKKFSRAVRRFRGDHTRVICAPVARQGLIAAVAKAADLGFEILSDEKISRAYFKFEFDTISRAAASKMKKLLGSVPAGVKLVGYEPRERVDARARGVELYAPVPEYSFRGKGEAEGTLDKLLSFRQTLAANEFFRVGDVVFER
jgi:hypothetical protein